MSVDAAFQYRPACFSDWENLRGLILAMAWESEGIKLDEETLKMGVQAVFNNASLGTYWVIEQGKRMIGCTLITQEWSDWHNAPYWWIQSLYIQPEFRGRGLFEGLLSTLEIAAKAQNVRELRLYVATNNHRAIRVYERNGFESEHYRCMTRTLI
jgi:ribosomal protein S18 acetylase RimI-like enzyme